jgi:hypothetical protein
MTTTRMNQPKPFAKETDLCAAFLSVLPETWTAYAECAGFDILLVRKADGVQVGVEAKLKLNAEVVSQALEDGGYYRANMANPDYRAVLVPYCDCGPFDRVAAYVGFTILRVDSSGRFFPPLPVDKQHYDDRDWHDWSPTKRCQLPEYVPDVAAGASAPVQLTQWKIAALRIEATLELRGYITRADFAHLRIDHRRWLARESGWLSRDGDKLIAGPHFPNWKAQHPKVYAEIVADAEAWMRKEARVLL